MSRLEKEEHDNYKKLYKLVFQVGLPLVRELFVKRYRQNHGHWEDTPEFGAKLLKMLDDQNNIKIIEPLENYERRYDIQNGKMSNWDFTTLYVTLQCLNFGNSPTLPLNRLEYQNKVVLILTEVSNKIAYDYWKEERIPTLEFNRLWTKTCDCCLYLGAEEAEMNNNIMKYYQIKNKFSKSAHAQNQRSSLPFRKGERSLTSLLFSVCSPQSNPNFSIASWNNYDIPKIEDKNKVVFFSPLPLKPKPGNSIYRQAVMGAVKKSIQKVLAAAAIISPAISSLQTAFLSPSANSASTTTTTSNTQDTNNKQLDAPKISSPTTFLSPAPNSSSFTTTTTVMSEAKRSIQNELIIAAIMSGAIPSPQTAFLSPPANSSSFTTTTTTPSTQDTNNQQLVAPQISSTISPSGQAESPYSPAQTPPTSETVNTTENSNPETPETSSTSGPLNSIDYRDTWNEEVFANPSENNTTSVSFPYVLLVLVHGIFLLVVSSLFLSRLMQHSEDSPLLLWKTFTLIAVCFGSLKIVLALFGFLSMIIKDPKARLGFNILFGLVHGLTIILFGVLVICFVLTNQYSATFLNWNDVEGRTSYNSHIFLISALSAEAGLVCISMVLLWGFPLCSCIKDALKKYL